MPIWHEILQKYNTKSQEANDKAQLFLLYNNDKKQDGEEVTFLPQALILILSFNKMSLKKINKL